MAKAYVDDNGEIVGKIPSACVSDCSHSGDCGPDVKHWVKYLGFTVPREVAIPYLRETGAWTQEELESLSDSDLAEKVFWIACGDISDGQEWIGCIR